MACHVGYIFLLFLWISFSGRSSASSEQPDVTSYKDQTVIKWLRELDVDLKTRLHDLTLARWKYLTNLTRYNQGQVEMTEVEFANHMQTQIMMARIFQNAPHAQYDSDTQRQLQLISQSADPRDLASLRKMSRLSGRLERTFGAAAVKSPYGNMELSLEPELKDIMASSRNPDELLWAWWAWRNVTGPAIRRDFDEIVKLLNHGAKQNGYSDMGEYWRVDNFELRDMDTMVDRLWAELKPLYVQLHAYVRRRLVLQYPELRLDPTGPIPAHLLGNMWAQDWSNLIDLVAPNNYHFAAQISDEMRRQNYTASRMFHQAEDFFTSIGLDEMTQQFWANSIINKPKDRTMECHGAAYEFHTGSDYRIKMCTKINLEHLETVHHEMGHIEYFMQYRHLAEIYHRGANSAFHEAVGDTIALSVMTPTHLRKLGLLKPQHEEGSDINVLLRQALKKIAFLPFGLVMEKWRWDVFRGRIDNSNYNREWWRLRLHYQGVEPPLERSERDFDPGAKYHIVSNVPYIRYFLSFITQFQFQDSMCRAMNHGGPLHQCSIYRSKAAGNKLRELLRLGGSVPWQEAMRRMTGGREFDTGPILSYFSPLYRWLLRQNAHQPVGW